MENSTTFKDNAPGLTEKASETAAHLKDKAAEFGRSAVSKIDESRSTAASGLENAASALHQNAENLPGGEKVSGFAHSAADKLNSTAEYVREHDVKRMMGDVEHVVKNNPGPSLLVAAAIGFLVGRAFSNRE